MNASSLFRVALAASIGITAVVASGSCLNNCGTYVNTDGVYCYCDDYCTYNGDCCDDAVQLCLSSPPPPGKTGSCQNNCGGQDSSTGCYCDSICSANPFGDCCGDWSQYCGSSPTPAPTGTCQGSCGGCAYDDYDYGSSGGCCCDSFCSLIGDCCADKDTYCSSPPSAEGSCDGYCGEYWGSYQTCHCDSVCTEYGDCCSDYNDKCNGSGADSCNGHCGDAYVGNCHCDDISTVFQDSCDDYAQYCGTGASPTPCDTSQDTCAGYCGTSAPSGNCYCDVFCTVAGDCCCDADTQCDLTKSNPGSCVGVCNYYSLLADGSKCYCDSFCTSNLDCCDDYTNTCYTAPPPPNSDSSCLVGNLCGTYNVPFSCGCDDACTSFGDCCYDADQCSVKSSPHGDSESDPILITSLPYEFEGSTNDYSDKKNVKIECTDDYPDEKSGVDIFFKYIPTANISVNITLCGEGTNFDSYVLVEEQSSEGEVNKQCNDDGDRDGCGLGSELVANLVAGVAYLIIIDGYSENDKGTFQMKINYHQGGSIADSIPVGPLPFIYEGNTQDYIDTYQPPQDCASTSTAKDVVFKFQPTKDISVSISLCGSGFDTILYIMDSTQSVLNDLCNDDADRDGCSSDAFLVLDAKQSVDYYIVVDGYDKSEGDFRLEITDLKGNTQEDAIDIGGILPFEDEGDTSTHTNNFDGVIAKGCAIATNAPDVFYEAFFTSNVDVTIDVCSDDFDTVLFVYQLGAESNPLLNKCNDDTDRQGCSKASSVAVTLQAGVTYFIVVDGVQGTSGSSGSGKYRLTIKQNNGDSSTSPIIIPSIPYVYDGQSGDYSHTFSIPSDCKATDSDAPDVWFQYTSPAPQQLNITTCGSAVDTAVALLSSGSSPNVIKCNDDGTHQECSTASELIVDVDADVSYYILVAFATSQDSSYRLEINSSLRP